MKHVPECTARSDNPKRKDYVPFERIVEEFEDDLRHWTRTGLRTSDMIRLVANHFVPLDLGSPGFQKASEAVHVGVW